MREAIQDPTGQPVLASAAVDSLRLVHEAPPAPAIVPAIKDEASSFERRAAPGNGSGIELQYPARLVWPSPWVGHIPFALWLVEALKPRVVVELGVHSGNSYCAFLQAIQSLGLMTQCFGIDHWRGDRHADYYGDEVYAELSAYHDPLYGSFSTLLRATFEDALPYFSDRSVDLLHIDGFHTYEAVAQDFADWLPKMSARGVVLFHDINVRERDFGVWRLWEEIAARYPNFTFVHSHGLGLVYLGSEPPPMALRGLLAMSDPQAVGRVRTYFGRLGTSLLDRLGRRQAEDIAARVHAAEAALEASRAEIHHHLEAAETLRVELGKAAAQNASLDERLAAATAESARQNETTTRLRAELTRQTDATIVGQMDAQQAAHRVAVLENELAAARAGIAQHSEAADQSYATLAEVTAQAAAVGEELARARRQIAEAIAQRERVTHLLRRQIAATAALQRELAPFRHNPSIVALVNRLAGANQIIPGPVKRLIKHRVLGVRS